MHTAGGELPRNQIRRSSHSGYSRKLDFHFTEFSEVRIQRILGSSAVFAASATIGATAPVGSVQGTGGDALMKRFVTLVTVSLVVAATITQWQRVKELSRQVLRRIREKMFTRTGKVDPAEDGDPL